MDLFLGNSQKQMFMRKVLNEKTVPKNFCRNISFDTSAIFLKRDFQRFDYSNRLRLNEHFFV